MAAPRRAALPSPASASTPARRIRATDRGALFFADYGRACVFAAPAGAGGAPNFAARQVVTTLPAAGVVDIEPGPNGDLLLVNINNSTIYELHYG